MTVKEHGTFSQDPLDVEDVEPSKFPSEDGGEELSLGGDGGGREGRVEERPRVSLDDLSEGEVRSALALYFHEAAKHPILTREEEEGLFKKIEEGRRAETRLKRMEPDASERRRERAEKEKAIGEEARREAVLFNLRLVISVAKRYRGQRLPFLDLIQEGNIGLIKAVEKFDYQMGNRFSTYATWWVRQAITRAVAYQSRMIRLPVHMGERVFKVGRERARLARELDRRPTDKELARAVELSPVQLERVYLAPKRVLSLEQPAGEEGESQLQEFIEDTSVPDLDILIESDLVRQQIEDYLEEMVEMKSMGVHTRRNVEIFRMRVGLFDGESYTQEEIGNKFGLSRERIRQIEGEIKRKLGHPRRARVLRSPIREVSPMAAAVSRASDVQGAGFFKPYSGEQLVQLQKKLARAGDVSQKRVSQKRVFEVDEEAMDVDTISLDTLDILRQKPEVFSHLIHQGKITSLDAQVTISRLGLEDGICRTPKEVGIESKSWYFSEEVVPEDVNPTVNRVLPQVLKQI